MTTGPGAGGHPGAGGPAKELGLPGLDEDLRRELDVRIADFEALHQQDVLAGGPGWVPRIRRMDYILAIAVNAVIVLWLVIVLMGGD